MSRYSAVHVRESIGDLKPGEVRGYIMSHTDKGVTINSREDGRGESIFIPTHNIILIKDAGF